MLEDLRWHSPNVLAVGMRAVSDNPVELGVTIFGQLDGEVRSVKGSPFRMISSEQVSIEFGAMATGTAEDVRKALAVRAHHGRVASLSSVEGNLGRFGRRFGL